MGSPFDEFHEWLCIKDNPPTDQDGEIVICYRDDESSYWEAQVLHKNNLSKCDWGEAYWIPLPKA